MTDPVLHALLNSINRREAVALVTVTGGSGIFADMIGHHSVLWPDPDRRPQGPLDMNTLPPQVADDARLAMREKQHRQLRYDLPQGHVELFVEVQPRPPHLIVVGAGHIAVPLAAIAKICDFEVTVLDDRPQYAHPARFPTADRVIAGPFQTELVKLRRGNPSFDDDTYIVLVTRGHQYDVACLVEVLDDPLAYLGMIGSQRRVRAVFELLEKEQGIPAAKFDRVYAPIGLDIGARTPSEIAVCMMAEIINVMRHGPAISLSSQIRQERSARKERAAKPAASGSV